MSRIEKKIDEDFKYQSLHELPVMCTSILRSVLLREVPSSRSQTCTSPEIVTDLNKEKHSQMKVE